MDLNITCSSVYAAYNEIQLSCEAYLLVCFYVLPDILLQKPNLLKQNPSMNTPELKDELENKGQNIYFQVSVTRIVNSLNLLYRLFPQKFFPLH